MYCVYTPYTSISRVPNHSTNQTPMRWLEVEPANHYTAQLAAMQLQNVVFKPNVWEKGNRGLRLNATLYVTFAWLAYTPENFAKFVILNPKSDSVHISGIQ